MSSAAIALRQNPRALVRAFQHAAAEVRRLFAEVVKTEENLNHAFGLVLEQRLQDGALPDITEENLLAFVAEYASDLSTLLAEMVAEVWEWLRPRESRWDKHYVTNAKNARLELGPRIILTGTVFPGYGRSRYRVGVHASPRMLAGGKNLRPADDE